MKLTVNFSLGLTLMNPFLLNGDLGIQKTGADKFFQGNVLISMDGYKDCYQHFLKEPSDHDNSIKLAMRQPGIQTIWNYRRKGILNGDLDPKNEIAWIRLLLTLHPKCSTLWNQLFWIIQQNQLLDHICFLEEIFKLGSKVLGNYS